MCIKPSLCPLMSLKWRLSDKAVRHAEFLAQQDRGSSIFSTYCPVHQTTMSRLPPILRRFEERLQHEAETRLADDRPFQLLTRRESKCTSAGNVRNESMNWPMRIKPMWW